MQHKVNDGNTVNFLYLPSIERRFQGTPATLAIYRPTQS